MRRTAAALLVALTLACVVRDSRGSLDTAAGGSAAVPAADPLFRDSAISLPPASLSQLTVRILDVGQGDATLIENGGSLVLIDGGPDQNQLGRHLDRLEINNDTIDVVLITHPHHDHYNGLRELFQSARRITVRYIFENRDISPNVTLIQLRDSILARATRGELVYRDTDDPCGDGTPVCTLFLRGGARLHIMKPDPDGDSPNNRSTPAKLVGADSASFTMWFAGDAERSAIDWFERTAAYHVNPGMKSTVLKANHHGSCNGISARYLDLVGPQVVTFSLGANDYGHVHAQTLDMLGALGIPWYRTDQNGEIQIISPGTPGGGYSVSADRGNVRSPGSTDRRSSSCPD